MHGDVQVLMRYLCRHHGPLETEQLHHFVADRLLQLPRQTNVPVHLLDAFLANASSHMTVVLYYSAFVRAAIPLQHAAWTHRDRVVLGQVEWKREV